MISQLDPADRGSTPGRARTRCASGRRASPRWRRAAAPGARELLPGLEQRVPHVVPRRQRPDDIVPRERTHDRQIGERVGQRVVVRRPGRRLGVVLGEGQGAGIFHRGTRRAATTGLGRREARIVAHQLLFPVGEPELAPESWRRAPPLRPPCGRRGQSRRPAVRAAAAAPA